VPLFDELRHELEQLPTNPLEGSHQFRERHCSQHKEKVSVFCETCRLCVCHECVLWENSPHRNHKFVKLEVLLQKQTKICEQQLCRLHEHMKIVLNQVQAVERKMEAVKGSKVKVRREMKEALDKMLERLETQYVAKQGKLGEARQKLKGRAMQLTRTTRDLENKIESGSIACLLSENGELRKDVLDKLEELQSMEIEPMPSIGEFYNEVVPSYTTGVFKVTPYSQLRDQRDEVYSKPLHMYGTVWRLKIYPNGHREDTGLYLSVFLELTESHDKKFKYQYCIEMLYNCSNKHPSRNYKKEYVSDFEDGESWGYRKFYELAKLESDGFLRDDTLVLRFSVRALTTHQKCRDLSTHVRRLEHRVESLQKELKQAKENARPSSSGSGSNTSSSTQGQNEAPPASYPNSPSRSRSVRHQHQHSRSEPIPPIPSDRSPRVREDRSRERRHEQAVRREQETRNSEERRRSEERHRSDERRRSEERRREQERRYDQERRREREMRQGERGYREHLQAAMSQQHSVRNNSQQLPGVKERGYLSQQRQSGEPPHYRSQRRESREGLREQRRRSADPTLLQHHFDNPISPPMYRHTLAPPPALPHGASQRQEHLHFRRDSAGSVPDETEFGSQASLLAPPSRHGMDRAPRFEEGSGDETGCSQPHPWGDPPLSHTDIQISIQDLGVPHSRPHHPGGPLHLYHAQSQEQFIDDDELGGGRMVFNLHDDSHAHHSFKSSDMPSHTSALSQPVHSSSRRRLQSSVPDLSLLTVTTSSNLAQGLSQSVLDMSRQRGGGGGDHASGHRPHHEVPRGNGAHRSSSQTYHTHLNHMPSDPHVNSEGLHHPGLMRTLLVRLKEEPEHSPAVHRRRTRGRAVGGASSSSQPPRRGYSEIRNRRRTPSPTPQQPSQIQPPARWVVRGTQTQIRTE
jgi:hypothetical protein